MAYNNLARNEVCNVYLSRHNSRNIGTKLGNILYS